MQNPFDTDPQRALHAHSHALATNARRVVDGKPARAPTQAAAKPATQARSKAGAAARELPRESHRLPCVHCGQAAVIRTSTQVTRLTREYVFCCTNPECGHTFVALMEVVRTLSPSATPDPSVCLPLSSHVRRDLVRAQLDNAAQAAHTPSTSSPLPMAGDMLNGKPLAAAGA